MSETIGGLLDDVWGGWSGFWAPKTVPAGAAYDAESLGMARANMLGHAGGTLLALAQGGVSPETRARLLAGLGDAPLTYQQSLLAGGEGRLRAAQTRKLEQEAAAQTQFNDMVEGIIRGRQEGRGGAPGTVARVTPGNVARTPGQLALAAVEGPESGGRADAVNSQGYSGRFQIGTGLASSAGLYEPAKDEAVTDDRGRAVNAWRGSWHVPGFDAMTHTQFLANPAAQQKAGEIAMDHNWRAIQGKGLDKYVGQVIGGVTITPQALLQGAWLGGVGGLETWLKGQGDPADSNKTKVSQWAGLTTPGTMTDAGAPAMVPTGSDGSTGAPGGQRFRGDLSQLSNQQLRLLAQMTPAERAQWLLKQSERVEPTPLTTEQKRGYGLDPGAVYVWDEHGKPVRLQEGRATELGPEEKTRLGYPSDAVVQRKSDGSLFVAKEGQARRLSADELRQGGYRPDAIVERKPDGTTTILEKGRDPNAPIGEGEARSILAEYSQRVRDGKLDPNSPEGQRYRAAYDLLAKPRRVDQEMPDGTTQQVTIRDQVPFPRLGDAPQGEGPITIKQQKPPTEVEAKTRYHLNQMTAADGRMEALRKKGWKEGQAYDTMVNKAPETVANWLRTKEGQLYEQAQVDWTLAKLRWESGAAIAESEAWKEYKRYFPQPFDSPEVVQQKNDARKTAMASMSQITGLPGASSGANAPAAPAAPAPDAATPLPQDVSPRAMVGAIRQRMSEGKMTREEGLKVMRKYGIHESWLED